MAPRIPQHPLGETMRAVCFTEFGPNVDLTLAVCPTIPKPSITSPNEILVAVHAASLNPIDKVRVQGGLAMVMPEAYDQSVLGYDVAGVVQQVGTQASKFKIGDEVYARLDTKGMKFGALAEYVVDNESSFGFKPSNISFSEAAAVPLAGLTALQALRRGGVTTGSKVFIAGGAGGVGSLAIQIAKSMLGASFVCTTASAGPGVDLCLKLGADRVIDYKSEDFSKVLKGEDFDMAFDTCNEASRMGSIIKQGGKIISISGVPSIEAISDAMGPPNFVVKLFMFMKRNRAAVRAAASKGGTWDYIFMKPSGKDLDDLAVHLKSGAIQVVIDTEAPSLEEFKAAAETLWSGRSKGKCVIKVV
jgi:NADPH:quinone reductase-like Zn-dependent oxidoreductase